MALLTREWACIRKDAHWREARQGAAPEEHDSDARCGMQAYERRVMTRTLPFSLSERPLERPVLRYARTP